MSIFACQDEVKVITTCPPAGSKILLFDVTGQPTGMALMDANTWMCCLISQFFGAGTITVKGSDLVAGLYYNSQFVPNLQVFAWNIPNYLIREGQNGLDPSTGQWRYILNSDLRVIGIEIYGIGYGDDDLFTISPNAGCNAFPVTDPTSEINERVPQSGVIAGVDTYELEWTAGRRSKYGSFGSFAVFQDDGSGNFQPTGIQPLPDDGSNPTKWTFYNLGSVNTIIVIS